MTIAPHAASEFSPCLGIGIRTLPGILGVETSYRGERDVRGADPAHIHTGRLTDESSKAPAEMFQVIGIEEDATRRALASIARS